MRNFRPSLLAAVAALACATPVIAQATNFQAYNDKVSTLGAIGLVNPTTGVPVSQYPAGTQLSITSSLPGSLSATLVTVGSIWLAPKLTPLVQNSPGITITISGPGYTTATFPVDVVPDPNPPLVITPNTSQSAATTTPQSVPTAPGP